MTKIASRGVLPGLQYTQETGAKRRDFARTQVKKCLQSMRVCLQNRPIVDCRVWVRDGASGPGPGLVHTALLYWKQSLKLAHLVTLSSSPVPCSNSCKNLSFSDGSWIFRLANGFFFFRKKSCATGHGHGRQTLRRPDSRSTCTAHRRRSHCRTHKKPTLQEKSRKLAYWQYQTLSRRKLLSSEHEHGCRSSTSPGCDQLSPSCSPVAQNWAAVFLFIYLFLKWA